MVRIDETALFIKDDDSFNRAVKQIFKQLFINGALPLQYFFR